MLPKNYMKPTQYKKGGKRKKSKGSGKPKPTNPSLWARAKAKAKEKFDVYPSAYANAWAAKWYKENGGGWRGGSRKKKAEGGFVGFGGPGGPTDPIYDGGMLGTAIVYPQGPSAGRLQDAMQNLDAIFMDKEGNPLKEGDKDFPTEFVMNDMAPYSGRVDPNKSPWSSATTSYLVGQYLGEDSREGLMNRGFRPSETAAHWTYINDAFAAAEDPNYTYNAYIAEEIPKNLNDVKVGDLFFRGYNRTKNKSFKGFKNLAKEDGYYPSHTDIVVDKGSDDKGEYVILAGGNVGDSLLHKKFYYDDVKKQYKGHMKQNPERAFKSVSELPQSSYRPAEEINPLADVDRFLGNTIPTTTGGTISQDIVLPRTNVVPIVQKANGGYMGTPEQTIEQAIMENQMIAMGIDPSNPYARMYMAGGKLYSAGGQEGQLTRIDAGGTHEENPLGGVPMGPDASVEEKETIQRGVEPGTDFVFSERLPEGGITPEMAQDAGLPKFVIGKSFAKASKIIEDKSSRSGDILDRNTREVTLARLRDAQEDHKEIEFQNQLAELEDKFGKSAQPAPQQTGQGMAMPNGLPGSQEEAMIQQMLMDQGAPAPQPSPQEMAMMQQMQQGMPGQRPPVQMAPGGPNERLNALLSGLGAFPSNPEDPNAAYMNLARSVYGDNDLQQAFDMARNLQGSGIPYADPNATAVGPRAGMTPTSPEELAAINNLYTQPGFDPVRAFTEQGQEPPIPMAPTAQPIPVTPEEIAFQNNLYQQEGFDPVTAYTGITPTGDLTSGQSNSVNYQVGPDGYHYFPNGLIVDPMTGQAISTSPEAPRYIPPTIDDYITDQEVKDANIKAFGTLDAEGNEDNLVDIPLLEYEEEEEPKVKPNLDPKDLTLEKFNNPYKAQILSDAGMKFLQGIKPIRERQAADYMLHADYDPILFPIEEQKKAISNMSVATKKQLSRRVNNPALYLAMAGAIDANESAETAKLFEKKFQVEAADNARIRELIREDRVANTQMKRLVDELNERDRQGKEQLLIEAANSFSNAYSGFSKEEFYSFMANQYRQSSGLLDKSKIENAEDPTKDTKAGPKTKKDGQ